MWLLIIKSCFIDSLVWQASVRLPHAEPQEMNKPPQPITGPPAIPHPAQSPGLTQVKAESAKPAIMIRHFWVLFNNISVSICSTGCLSPTSASLCCFFRAISTNEHCTATQTGTQSPSCETLHDRQSFLCVLWLSYLVLIPACVWGKIARVAESASLHLNFDLLLFTFLPVCTRASCFTPTGTTNFHKLEPAWFSKSSVCTPPPPPPPHKTAGFLAFRCCFCWSFCVFITIVSNQSVFLIVFLNNWLISYWWY